MPGAKLQPNNPANDPDLKPVKGHSKFVPNMSLYKTHRYGIIEPHFAFEPVPDDKNVSYRSGTDVDTQNLKAPLMTPLKLNKDTLFVPLSAILPHNWELLETNPLSGQDINPLQVNTLWGANRSYVVNGLGYISTELMKILDGTRTFLDSKCYLTALLAWTLNYYQHGSPVFSYGSLAQSLGYNFAADYQGFYVKNRAHRTDFDETIEVLFSEIKRGVKSFRCGLFQPKFTSNTPSIGYDLTYVNVVVSATENSVVSGSIGLTLRSFLELLEQGSIIFRIENLQVQDNFVDIAFDPTLYGIENLSTTTLVSLNTVLSSSFSRTVNLSRLIAYQLVCASYFTDDAVDYVYTSKLWHQNMMALFCATVGSTSSIYGYTHYTLNGINMEYDSVSRAILDRICSSYQSLLLALSDYACFHINSSGDATQPTDPYYQNMIIYGTALKDAVAYEYFNNIFGYQRALRYRDYFVGARPNPLAVGDVTVAVNQNLVDVVDVTKKIQMQRFLNQVNRIGRRISDYAAGIFGVAPRKDNDEPIFLSHVSMTIGAEETSNTGPSQLEMAQTTTSKLRKDSSNFIFSTDFSSFGVIIGVTTVEMIRPLPNAADRQLFHADRFDMFNPYMQHVGDQEVYQAELDPIADTTISYKLRYSEYKMRTDRMAGGFVSQQFLPGFAFPITSDDLANPLANSTQLKISPDFIRQKPHEFDKFFNALPFNSMAGYFHFIIRHDNEVSALRPMEAAPSIL